jgi:hypothetical protein
MFSAYGRLPGAKPEAPSHPNAVRIVLTLIAVSLVAALSAALVAPLFIDWSAQRGFLETQIAERLGVPVSIAGAIDVRLLPTPYLTLGKVTVSRAVAGVEPELVCEGMRLELALGGLFNGQFRFNEVDLDRPELTLGPGLEASIPDWGARFAGLADRVALDRIVINKGRLNIAADGAAPLVFADIDVDASATSLNGPFRGAGAVSTLRDGRVEFQFASAEIADAALPIKADLDWGAGGPRAAFDGKLSMASPLSLSYAGAVTFSGSLPGIDVGAPTPWRVSGALFADRRHAKLDALDLRLGQDERALDVGGAAQADFGGDFVLDAQLSAKQLNIDSLLRRQGEDSAPPARLLDWLKTFGSVVTERAGFPLQLNIGFSTDTVFLGAQTLDGLSLSLASKPGEPLTGRFETGLPGQSHVRLSGALELGAAAVFNGQIEAHVGDFSVLKDWIAEGKPELASRLSALFETFRYADASATGDIAASAAGVSARNLKLVVDRSTLTGAVTYALPVAGERGRLHVDLRSDALDIDAAPNLGAGADWLDDFDLSLDLEATKLRIARVGQAAVDSGSLVLKATKTGATFSLDRLSVENLGGASIEAQGETAPTGRWATVRLDAAHLRDFAALVARVAPGRYSRMLVDRADALSPAKATLQARRAGPPLEGPFPLDFLTAQGEAGEARFSIKLSNAPAPVGAIAADLSLDAADGAVLLKLMGAKPPAAPIAGAHLAASASGRWEAGFDARLRASLAGADLNWRGRFVPVPVAPDDRNAFGAATLKADNLLLMLAMFGMAAPNAGPVAPADLSADFVLRGAEASLHGLSGTVAGARISGNLVWLRPEAPVDVTGLDVDLALARSIAGEAPTATPAQISGNVSVDRATLGGLLALPLGAPAAVRTAARWSDAPFAEPLFKPPPTDIRLRIGALDIWEGLPAQNLAARLQMDSGKFDLDEIAVDVAGGHASGRLTLRRDGPVAALEGKIGLASIGFDRPGVRGRLGASLAIAGTGKSPSALVAGLVGEGQVTLAGASIPRLDPGALGRVMEKAQALDAPIDETNVARALTLELDRRSLAIPDGAVAAALNSGVLRIGPLAIPEPSGHAMISGDFDLRSWNLQIRAAFEEARAGKFWSGSPPAATVVIRGALDAPTRVIDVASLVAGLATQAIARESDRIAGLEADMRERAFFNRVLKSSRFLRGRAAEIAAYQAEQARLKSEADRKRVEASLLKASADQMKKASDPVPAIDAAPAVNDARSKPPSEAEVDPKRSARKAAPAMPAIPLPPDPTAGGLY